MCLDKCKKYSDLGFFVVRLVVGFILLVAGWSKIFGEMGVAGFAGMLEGSGVPIAIVFAWIVAIVELVGGILVVLGLYTRWSALLAGIVMLVAGLMLWAGAFAPDMMGSGFNAARWPLLAFASLLALLMDGAGAWSLDAKFNIKQ